MLVITSDATNTDFIPAKVELFNSVGYDLLTHDDANSDSDFAVSFVLFKHEDVDSERLMGLENLAARWGGMCLFDFDAHAFAPFLFDRGEGARTML